MKFDLMLRNGKIVTPSGIIDGDIGISQGKIAQIGRITEHIAHEKAGQVKDCAGLFILPGAIDMHVHFRDPGFPAKEDFGSGSEAAAAGGVTTVFDMPNTNPPTITCAALEEKRAIAAAKSHVNYGFYMGLTSDNILEIRNAKNIAGVKIYMGSSTGNLLVQDLHIIERVFESGILAVVHGEDEKIIRENQKRYKNSEDPSVHSLIRSPDAAFHAVKELLHLAKKHNARVHVTHCSTVDEVEELRKFHGPTVSADCTPHHLFLSQSAYADRGNFVKMNPPLRTNKDRHALLEALRRGYIQAVASDHAPHTKGEKEQTYSKAPAGVPGTETLLPLLFDAVHHGELTLHDVAKITAENPARILGIRGKGRIEAGYDADLAIVDMEKTMEVGHHNGPHHGFFTKCGWSPFSGWKLKGWPVTTIVNGEIAYENGRVNKKVRGREIAKK
ncbi:dihydroorotase [Candidatus Peregrinibacteria bacterium]|nr:dihydroorotase [Candidatus Peregrinibacteria bacterium]